MLVFLTLLHGGVRLERLNCWIEYALAKPLESTYNVSLLAMCLYELWKLEKEPDVKERYVNRARQCAQHLVDNQTSNGQWRYGFAVPLPPDTDPPKEPTISTGGAGSGVSSKKKAGSTEVRVVAGKRAYGTDGDNSNSQYAALGLRACMDVGIEIPREVLDLAVKWWQSSQESDGGWGYGGGGKTDGKASWGSMTAGAIGALAIYKFYLTRDLKAIRSDPAVSRGLKWLEQNFTVEKNPLHAKGAWHYYFLYGLERAGMLCGTETIGRNEWYPIGATYLLKEQKTDGHWLSSQPGPESITANSTTWDTCFAILFLRRATRPLVIESEEGHKK
jgi:hypothetical protein